MKDSQPYMYYYEDYGGWLKVDGDYGRAMNIGETFHLLLDKELKIPCRLGLAGKHLWYLEIGEFQVHLILWKNKKYEIED